MDERNRILTAANGPLSARLMFVGEAPGRRGANVTLIPFHGDAAGANFERLLAQAGLDRYQCFVTNAVLCNPRDDDGNNATPTNAEIANCTSHLKRQIDLVDPAVIATLGARALQALDIIEPHGLTLSSSVRHVVAWHGRKLIPLYHPGQRAMIHRSFHNQLSDYKFVAEMLSHPGRKLNGSAQLDETVSYCVHAFLRRGGAVNYFKLHKLYYLLEYAFFKKLGRRMSRAYIIRQKDGPYVTDLHVSTLRRSLRNADIVTSQGDVWIRQSQNERDLFGGDVSDTAKPELDEIITNIWAKYGDASNEQLKTAVYMTRPMRTLLRAEANGDTSTYNRPIMFDARQPL